MALEVHESARADLRILAVQDKKAAARILALLEEIRADANFLDLLLANGRGKHRVADFEFNVKSWREATKHVSGELWRLRVFGRETTGYRIVYGYHWQTQQLCVLAVAPKEQVNYDNVDTGLAERVVSDWRRLVS